MKKSEILCDRRNHGGKRSQAVRYIVVHYTAGDGDTARDNAVYFSRTAVGASAHWFVDEREAVLSVPEEFAAWHCGGTAYVHAQCRNGNSIGVELCSRKREDGTYWFADGVIRNGARLVRELMARYEVPAERVLRHYDVTGKKCPAPFVEAGAWNAFKEELMRYDQPEQLPEWARGTVERLMAQGHLKGDGQSLDLSPDMVRLLVILERAGCFGSTAEAQENP